MTRHSAADVFKAYRERLLTFIRSRVRTLEDAEDILQDVFYQFTRVEDRANPVEQTAAWLYRAARNKIIDSGRKKKDAPLPVFRGGYGEDEKDNEEYVFDNIADILYGQETTPETECLRALLLAEIQSALDELPEEQRTVFELTEIMGLPAKEAARGTHAPLNTVLSRKHYAVKHLRKSLAELYADLISG
ncbi:MAG: sigma-70 family RNA polymerase sigma factor [Spirochaetaceae bacterium]|jgi:RNA polymerase sigma factor (sigma-70 family)|nr:sigma-70 family RNA polymerase sigma factor [Spirochaetaceae bacterium]